MPDRRPARGRSDVRHRPRTTSTSWSCPVPPGLTRGSAEDRQAAYLEALHRFPAVLNPRLLERATQVSQVVSVPETMLRGFRRRAAGPGWALVGDAGVYKHPATGQGISDALAQAGTSGRQLV